jgi:calcium-dependent protein kinase
MSITFHSSVEDLTNDNANPNWKCALPEEHPLSNDPNQSPKIPEVLATAPKATNSQTDRITDYIKTSGPTCSRIMVHFENSAGMPIEAVYDGVHDGDILGEGVNGLVRLITHKKTGIKRAVKRLDLVRVAADDDIDRLIDEIKIMCSLDHPNIVCLEEVYEGDSELYLAQELCKGGDLFDRLDEQPDYHYSEAGCARLVKQIASAVAYLHSKGVIHRDLKLENFMFKDKGNDSELKLIDFGLSKHFQEGDLQTEKVGTPYTVAPEVILGKGYDEKCDVWSIGVICYLLLCGETPFGGACLGDDLGQVRKNIISGNVP